MKRLIPMSLIQREIVHLLCMHWRENPISRRQLMRELGALGLDVSDRKMRWDIEILNKYHHAYVGRSLKGYYWRRSVTDDEATIRLLEKKAFAMLSERSLIRKQMKARGQQKIDFR